MSVRFSSVDYDFCVVSERYSGRVRVIGDDGCDVRVVEFGSVGVFPAEPLFVIHKSVGVKGDKGDYGGAFTQTIGNGTDTSFTVTHNLNTRAIIHSVRQAASPYSPVLAGISIKATTVNTATIEFDTAPASNEFVVVIVSGAGQKGDTGATGSTGATGAAGSGTPATATPLMNGTAAVGASTTKWAREDHVHPSDTNKATFLSIPAASIPYRSYGDGSSGEPNWYLTPIESSTANTIMRRDGSGRSQIEAPSADKDIANKKYVDDAIGAAAPVDVLAYAFGGF